MVGDILQLSSSSSPDSYPSIVSYTTHRERDTIIQIQQRKLERKLFEILGYFNVRPESCTPLWLYQVFIPLSSKIKGRVFPHVL